MRKLLIIALVIFVAIVWLSILLILTSADYATRSWTVTNYELRITNYEL